jgi:hypothetical protein
MNALILAILFAGDPGPLFSDDPPAPTMHLSPEAQARMDARTGAILDRLDKREEALTKLIETMNSRADKLETRLDEMLEEGKAAKVNEFLQAKRQQGAALNAGPVDLFTAMLESIEIDEVSQKTLISAAPPHRLVLLTATWCVNCSWSKEIFLQPHPGFVVEHVEDDVPEDCKYIPAIWDPETRHYYHNSALEGGWESLVRVMNRVRREKEMPLLTKSRPQKISVGTIGTDEVESVVRLLGRTGRFNRDSDPYEYTRGMFALRMPGRFGFDWSTAGDLTTYDFGADGLQVKLGVLRRKVSSVIVSPDLVTLNIEWFPDLSLDRK